MKRRVVFSWTSTQPDFFDVMTAAVRLSKRHVCAEQTSRRPRPHPIPCLLNGAWLFTSRALQGTEKKLLGKRHSAGRRKPLSVLSFPFPPSSGVSVVLSRVAHCVYPGSCPGHFVSAGPGFKQRRAEPMNN